MFNADDFNAFVQNEAANLPDLDGPDFPDDTTGETHVPPCRIHLGDGTLFDVTDIDAWEWHQYGIFATGRGSWEGAKDEEDILVPLTSIKYIHFNFEALSQWLKEQAEADGTSA